MAEDIISEIARRLRELSAQKRDVNLVDSLRNEKYQRTFTDSAYPERARPGFKRVPEEQKQAWDMLRRRGEEE